MINTKKKYANKKTTIKLLLLVAFAILMSGHVEAQFLNKLAKHAKEKVEKEAQKRSEKRIDKNIDKGFDSAENTIDGKDNDPKKETDCKEDVQAENSKESNTSKAEQKKESNEPAKAEQPTIIWNKYDFVPGDQVFF